MDLALAENLFMVESLMVRNLFIIFYYRKLYFVVTR